MNGMLPCCPYIIAFSRAIPGALSVCAGALLTSAPAAIPGAGAAGRAKFLSVGAPEYICGICMPA